MERNCPYCTELIKYEAIKCKHCHSEVQAQQATMSEKVNAEILTASNIFGKIGTFFIYAATLPIIAFFIFGPTVGIIAFVIGILLAVGSLRK